MAIPPSNGGTGRRFGRRLVAVGMAGAFLTAALVPSLWYRPPSTVAAIPSGEAADQAAARMLSKASSIRAGLERPGEWGDVITEAEANAWLAIELPRIAGGRIPPGWRSLAVRFHPRRLACSGVMGEGIASIRWWTILDVALARDDQIVIGVDSAGLGLLPIPAATVLSALARGATEAGWPAEIRHHQGVSRLHVTLVARRGEASSRGAEYHLEGLRIDEGELVLAGSTRSRPHAPDMPTSAAPPSHP